MIVVDTNVISEVMKPAPSPQVLRWMSARPASGLFTTTITMAEVLSGLELIARGRRRALLQQAAETMFETMLAGHVLGFDIDAAHAFARISAKRRGLGRPMGELDAQIAAVAYSRGAAIATRNTRDFTDCGLELIDPWAD